MQGSGHPFETRVMRQIYKGPRKVNGLSDQWFLDTFTSFYTNVCSFVGILTTFYRFWDTVCGHFWPFWPFSVSLLLGLDAVLAVSPKPRPIDFFWEMAVNLRKRPKTAVFGGVSSQLPEISDSEPGAERLVSLQNPVYTGFCPKTG